MLSDSLATYAESVGIGTKGVDLFARIMPDSPDNAVCIFDEPGPVTTEMHTFDADMLGTHWMVRGSYTWAMAKVMEIHRKVSNLHGEYGFYILQTFIQTSPAFVENDDKGRAIYSVHYTHDVSIGGNLYRQGFDLQTFDETFDETLA
jgi:hypothetical protein